MTNHPNRAVTYTVLNRHGDVQGSGLSLRDAAEIVLYYDGHEYDIRQGDDGVFRLWTSPHSRHSSCWRGLTKSVICSHEPGIAPAKLKIYREVIQNAEWFQGLRVLTDSQYAAEIAEIRAQDAHE